MAQLSPSLYHIVKHDLPNSIEYLIVKHVLPNSIEYLIVKHDLPNSIEYLIVKDYEGSKRSHTGHKQATPVNIVPAKRVVEN